MDEKEEKDAWSEAATQQDKNTQQSSPSRLPAASHEIGAAPASKLGPSKEATHSSSSPPSRADGHALQHPSQQAPAASASSRSPITPSDAKRPAFLTTATRKDPQRKLALAPMIHSPVGPGGSSSSPTFMPMRPPGARAVPSTPTSSDTTTRKRKASIPADNTPSSSSRKRKLETSAPKDSGGNVSRKATENFTITTPAALVALPFQLPAFLPHAHELTWAALRALSEHPDSGLSMSTFEPALAMPQQLWTSISEQFGRDIKLYANNTDLGAADIQTVLQVQAASAAALALPEADWVGGNPDNAVLGDIFDQSDYIDFIKKSIREPASAGKGDKDMFVCKCMRDSESKSYSRIKSSADHALTCCRLRVGRYKAAQKQRDPDRATRAASRAHFLFRHPAQLSQKRAGVHLALHWRRSGGPQVHRLQPRAEGTARIQGWVEERR